MFDPDYELLSGRPVIRRIYHTALYGVVEVAITDIGRAPRPETPATGQETIAPEPPEVRVYLKMTTPANTPIRDRVVAVLEGERGLSVDEIGERTGLSRQQVVNCIGGNTRLFDTWRVQQGRGRRMWAKLKQA